MEVEEFERYRRELVAHCYRMLGSPFDAEDAVQETFLRAWRRAERFDERRGTLRAWLYSIATNICLDLSRAPQRRVRAMDLAAPAAPGAPFGDPHPDVLWVQPMLDPADLAEGRDSVRLAFVAALQHLPPRQRAVLLLRDVLRWSAAEVARLLETSVPSVNSALQRARAAMPVAPQAVAVDRQQLLERYVRAFEAYDVDALVALLHEDATMAMPPYQWWLRGRAAIEAVLRAAGAPCAGSRLVQVGREPVFGQYGPDGHAFGLVVLDAGETITGMTTYLDAPELFASAGLPMSFAAPARTGR